MPLQYTLSLSKKRFLPLLSLVVLLVSSGLSLKTLLVQATQGEEVTVVAQCDADCQRRRRGTGRRQIL